MPATAFSPDHTALDSSPGRRLLVAWQHPVTRAYALVGLLDLPAGDGPYRFRYLPGAALVDGFHPFVELPDLAASYSSAELFRLFENRMTPRDRADYSALASSVGLDVAAEPFEVLVRTGGRRATDTVEVLDSPTVDGERRTITTEFLAHGTRYLAVSAEPALTGLRPGDRLRVLLDVHNPRDPMALVLADDTTCNLGWVPRYLAPVLHQSAARSGWRDINVRVVHVGDPAGPPHMRLLCCVSAPWDPAVDVLDVLTASGEPR